MQKCQWLRGLRVCSRPVGERGQRREVAICDHCFTEYEQTLVKREVRGMMSALKTSAKLKKKHKASPRGCRRQNQKF